MLFQDNEPPARDAAPSSTGSRSARRGRTTARAVGRVATKLGAALASLLVFGACDVHEGHWDPDEEFNAGGIDPYNFPPAYRGHNCFSSICVRQTAGSGTFTEVLAFAKGQPVGYYAFPFSPSQVHTTGYSPPSGALWPEGVVDPLRVSGPGTDFRQSSGNPVPVPMVYNFDPPGGLDPFAPAHKCKAPANYQRHPFWDAIPLNEQWNVFTFPPDRFASFPFAALPTWSYRPVVAEVPVTTKDYACQAAKSERTLLKLADEGKLDVPRGEPEADKRFGRLGLPTPDRFLAWAIIDPGAAVVRVGERPDLLQGGKVNGISVQKYGWYGQFIVAYIDGGYIPVEDGPRVGGAPTKRMRPMRLYYPRSPVIRRGASSPTPGALGQGYDVVQADRFTDPEQYSPVCEVWTYELRGPTRQEDLPKDEATIIELANSTLEPARTPQSPTAVTPNVNIVPRYIFCLQAAPLPTEE